MKKFFVSLAVVCMISLLAVSAFAYNSYDNDWGCKIKQESDGSITVTFDKEKIEASGEQAFTQGDIYVTIYYTDPGFTADSKMAAFEDNGAQGKYVYTDAVAGPGFVGRPDRNDTLTYNIKKGEGTGVNEQGQATGEYAFEQGKTYYVFAACNNSSNAGVWIWNRKAVTFTYGECKPTADFSVIAYAVAAITGCGALVVAKKRG